MNYLLKIFILISVSANAQYRNDMPEVIQSNSKDGSLQCTEGHYHKVINSQIGYQYQQMGQPKILVLLGRELGSDLSQWQADTRETISTMNRAYQGGHQAKDTRDTYRMTESRKIISRNISSGMQSFYRGFVEYMQAAGLGTVSYDSILRQAQRKNELTGVVDRSTDKFEVEADAILENVDILIEILDAGSDTVLGKTVDKIMVRVTRMDNYITVAQYLGQAGEYYKLDEFWDTNSTGYEKQKRIYMHHADVGYRKAEELLSIALQQPFLRGKTPFSTPENKPNIKKKKRILPPGN